MNPIYALFDLHDDPDQLDRMVNAFVSVLTNSTWYACEVVRGYPSKEELIRLSNGMVYYVMSRADSLYDNESLLESSAINCRIGIFELAQIHSSDFIFEAAYGILRDKELSSLQVELDRLSAACLFRYKYCCLHEKLFLFSWIHQWAKISKAITQASSGNGQQLDKLLIALEYLEPWSEEIARKHLHT